MFTPTHPSMEKSELLLNLLHFQKCTVLQGEWPSQTHGNPRSGFLALLVLARVVALLGQCQTTSVWLSCHSQE